MANNWAVSKLGTSDFPLQLPGKQITGVCVRTGERRHGGKTLGLGVKTAPAADGTKAQEHDPSIGVVAGLTWRRYGRINYTS